MQCPTCKTALSGEAAGCWRCGRAPKGKVATVAEAPDWTPETSWRNPPAPKTRRGGRWRWFVGLSLALVVGATLAVIVGSIAWGYYTGDTQVARFERGDGRVFANSDGGFRVRFPVAPDRTKSRTVDGLRFTSATARVGRDHTFTVAWADLKGQSVVLGDVSAPESPGGAVTDSKSKSFQGKDARVVTSNNGSRVTRTLTFVDRDRVYVIANTTTRSADDKEWDVFVKSFELTRSA